MPTITLSKKDLLKKAGKLSDEQLKDRISMLGTDLEGIEGDLISVEIFPNRPDLLSQQGFNRAFSSFIDTKPGLSEYDVKKPTEKVIIEKSVAKCRPFTACAVVKKLKITEDRLKEIIQIQEKLHVTFGRNRKRVAIGIYPIEKITFPITFKGLKPEEIRFRPLEAKREMSAKQILTEHPKGKEYAHLLDGLKRYACFVDAKKNILSLTPIINSHLTGKINEKTTEVFVECSGFDLRILEECLAMIVTSLADMGGEIHALKLEYPEKTIITPNLKPSKMVVDKKYINRLLGLTLKDNEFKALFERMGYGYEGESVLIPPYRTDILHQADLAEDVAIAYGYEKIEEKIPNVATTGQESPLAMFETKLRSLLIGHSLLECKNYNLISKETQTDFMGLKADVVELASSVSEEYDTLRTWILPSLMETLQRNKRHEYPQRLFEIGRVFSKGKSETGVKEKEHLAVVLCGEDVNYTTIRQVLDDLFSKLELSPHYKETVHNSFIQGRVARVSVGKDDLAYVGELHPQVLENFNLTMPTVAFELDLTTLFKLVLKGEKSKNEEEEI